MPKWTPPTESLPDDFCAGDRILGILCERNPKTLKFERRLVILEATEDGWRCDDDTYAGYSIHDCEYWSTEKDVVKFAEMMSA